MPGEALKFANVTVRRGPRDVLSDLSFTLNPGEILAVIGPNGSGKSSLAMAAAGLLAPVSGTIMVGARNLSALTAQARAPLVAYVPQRSELVAPLAVSAVVAMGRYAHLGEAAPSATAAIAAALTAVDAHHLADRNFAELSGGEAQRVLIARALATGAKILLLDEPTSALDIGHRLALGTVLRTRAQAGDAVLVALHDLNEAHDLADRVLLLNHGHLREIGTPAAVIAPAPVRAVYGVDLTPRSAFAFRPASGSSPGTGTGAP